MLAVLIALGLVAGSVDARALGTSPPPATAALTLSVDQSDDLVEVGLVVPVLTPRDDTGPMPLLLGSEAPPGYEHCWFVFRPPRTYAFN